MAPRSICICLLLCLLRPGTALGERIFASVTLPAAQDNTLFEHPDGALSSGAGPTLFCGNNSLQKAHRAVLAFDVAANLPAGALIDSVGLRLVVSNAPNDTPRPISLHRLLADWGEGTSFSTGGAGVPATAEDATWRHTFYPDQYWSVPGGDFETTASAEIVVSADGPHVWSTPQMAADVQAWLATPGIDFGWILRGVESEPSTARRFDSRENDAAENRPALTVHYSYESTAISVTNWSVLKSRYRPLTGRPQ